MALRLAITGIQPLPLNRLKNIRSVIPGIVRSGVAFAKRNAPGKYSSINPGKSRGSTGSLREAIYGRYGITSAGVYVRTPNHPDGRARPYQMWHHGRGIYPQVQTGHTRPRSGRANFLVATNRFMKRIAKERFLVYIRTHLNE